MICPHTIVSCPRNTGRVVVSTSVRGDDRHRQRNKDDAARCVYPRLIPLQKNYSDANARHTLMHMLNINNVYRLRESLPPPPPPPRPMPRSLILQPNVSRLSRVAHDVCRE